MTTRFVPNYRGIEQEMNSAEMQAAILRICEEMKDDAKAIAPFDSDDGGGHYRDMIVASVRTGPGACNGRVGAYKYTSGWIEFGTIKTPKFAPLRRAAERFGVLTGGKGD